MQPATTAEWTCTRCGVTNRKLVPIATDDFEDTCVTCHAEHEVERPERPTRWKAKLDD
jgi:hypothetical protein